MANTKISDLTDAATLVGTEQIPIVQSGSNVKTTTSRFIKHDLYTSATDVDNFITGTVQHIDGTYTNAPTANAGDHFIIFTIASGVSNGEKYQTGIQVLGTGIGSIYNRRYPSPSGPYGSWTVINDPAT